MPLLLHEIKERLKELEAAHSLNESYGGLYTTSGAGKSAYHLDPIFANLTQLPEGLTVDDLKQAHLEACMEEEVLNG